MGEAPVRLAGAPMGVWVGIQWIVCVLRNAEGMRIVRSGCAESLALKSFKSAVLRVSVLGC